MHVRPMIAAIVVLLALLLDSQARAQDESDHLLIPILGSPYVSETGSGGIFVGSISIDSFRTDGLALAASGLLRFGRSSKRLDFPVHILRADCAALELKIGPPDFRGLQDPLFLIEQRGDSELRQANFCEIGQAAAEGDLDQLVSLLNEEDLLAAGFLGGDSCPWYRAIECAGVTGICSAACALSPIGCVKCLVDAGSGICIDCICPKCCSQVPPGTQGC